MFLTDTSVKIQSETSSRKWICLNPILRHLWLFRLQTRILIASLNAGLLYSTYTPISKWMLIPNKVATEWRSYQSWVSSFVPNQNDERCSASAATLHSCPLSILLYSWLLSSVHHFTSLSSSCSRPLFASSILSVLPSMTLSGLEFNITVPPGLLVEERETYRRNKVKKEIDVPGLHERPAPGRLTLHPPNPFY